MAKKKSKQQPKQPNSANGIDTTEIITSMPTTAPTHISFCDFIKLADIDTINDFLSTTTTILESQNLEALWKRAYKEGYERGRKSLLEDIRREMEDMYDEGLARGKDLGREEGYMIAKEAFDSMVMQLKARDAPKISTNDTSTQTAPPTTATASISVQTNPTTFASASQSPMPSKNTKIYENSFYYSEISPKTTVFSSPTPSATYPNSTTLSTTTRAPETRQITADFAQKHGKVEKTHIPTKMSPEIHALGVNGPGNDTTRVYTSQLTPNDDVLHSLALSTTANSLPISHPTNHEKSELHPDFESQPPTEHTAPTLVNTSLKTRSASGDFTENHQKVEKYPISIQNSPESLVSTRFSWADDITELPMVSTAPTKCPRDISALRSSSTNPFSSLQRRCWQPRKSRRFINSWPQSCCQHTSRKSHFYSSPRHTPRHPSQPHIPLSSVTLDWDRDPRLADLSNALRALGWSRW